MSDSVKIIDLKKITIGERFRKDLGDINQLIESVKEKGILQPITVNQDFVLLAGGRRVAAAHAAGLSKIPALIRDQSSMEFASIDLREVELIENVFRKDFSWEEHASLIAEIDSMCRAKHLDWSVRKTAKLLGESHPMNVSRSLQLAEALQVMPELAQCKTQDEAIKFIKHVEEDAIMTELRRRQDDRITSATTNGDRYIADFITLAKTNYHIGDAITAMKALPAGAGNLHLIEVDPPYGIELNEQKRGDSAATYKEVPRNEYAIFLKEVAEQTFRIAPTNCWMVWWFGPTHHQLVLTTLREAGWIVDEIPAIWNKGYGQTMSPENYFARAYEPFFLCKKGAPGMAKRGRSNVFNYTPVAGVKKYHPTERPVELIEDIIETLVGINSHILIPFLGSGASLRACYNTGGTGWGYDLNPEYRDKFLLAVEADVRKLNDSDEE